jgi:hypothetical protein
MILAEASVNVIRDIMMMDLKIKTVWNVTIIVWLVLTLLSVLLVKELIEMIWAEANVNVIRGIMMMASKIKTVLNAIFDVWAVIPFLFV